MAVSAPSSGSDLHLPELRIVLLGNRESGKSSAGNIILGKEEFDPDARRLQCVKRQGKVAGRNVTVVDTPGWTDCNLLFSKDSPNLLKQELVLSVALCPPGPHAFLLVIHENTTFSEAEKDAMSNHLSLLGHDAWEHSLVLFIQESPAREQAFENKGKMMKLLLEECGGRYHVLNINKRDDKQVKELLEKIDCLVAATEHQEMDSRSFPYVEGRTKLDKCTERRMETGSLTGKRRIPKEKI
ncbi:GTPase IMAP family member 9-like [Engraulis encrasicolus]|uniref:GTPase IMAP family member 9-like n=1 Tax=Engraulis encrasicolus TaxID=184585 RepID=UPI002FCE97EA